MENKIAILAPAVRRAMLCGTALSLLGASPVCAQQLAEAQPGDIIVTAQKRAERLQDVPFSISAVQGEDLINLGAEGFRTFANRVPGLQLIESSPIDTQLGLRGIVTARINNDQPQLKPTVGLYFDDVAMELAANNPNFQLFDLERVEVLRGPQGTLFGASSMGGAIRYVTRKPDLARTTASGGASLSDTRYGEMNYQIDGTVNVPLIPEKLALRITGYGTFFGGFLDNLGTGENNSNDVDTYGGRIALRAAPTENLTIDLLAVIQQLKLRDANSFIPAFGDMKSSTFLPTPVTQTSRLFSGTIQYETDNVQLTSVTGYLRKKDSLPFQDLQGFLPFFGLAVDAITLDFPTWIRSTGFSQELRLSSVGDGAFRWIVGGFYSKRKTLFTQYVDAPGIEDLGFPPGELFGVGTDRIFDAIAESRTRQFALFGDVTVMPTPQLEITAGLRWFDARDRNFYDLRGLLEGGVDITSPEISEDGFNPKLNVAYKITRDNQVYAQIAKGFRLGGGNTPVPIALCESDLAAIGLTQAPPSFNSDSLWSYEVGTKNKFGPGLTFNAAAFFVDWSKIQLQASLACGFSVIQNNGKLHSKGLEMEFGARLATGVNLSGSMTYTDSTIRNDIPEIGASRGDRAPFVPKFQGNIALDLERPVGDMTGFASINLQYVGDRRSALVAANSQPIDDYTVGNLRIGLQRGAVQLSVFADNIWDERGQLGNTRLSFGAVGSQLYRTTIRPRTIGVSVRLSQ